MSDLWFFQFLDDFWILWRLRSRNTSIKSDINEKPEVYIGIIHLWFFIYVAFYACTLSNSFLYFFTASKTRKKSWFWDRTPSNDMIALKRAYSPIIYPTNLYPRGLYYKYCQTRDRNSQKHLHAVRYPPKFEDSVLEI